MPTWPTWSGELTLLNDTEEQGGGGEAEVRDGAGVGTILELIRAAGGHVTVACDTEFSGPHTLTIQFAARLSSKLVVQRYYGTALRVPSKAEMLRTLRTSGDGTGGRRVVLRDPRPIPADLSPAVVLGDLSDLAIEPMGRAAVVGTDADGAAFSDSGPDGDLTVTIVGPFLHADFLRMFGRDFLSGSLKDTVRTGGVRVQDRRLLASREIGTGRTGDPVLDSAGQTVGLYAVRVRYFDTGLAFGTGKKLDDLARMFAGVGKLEGVGEADKADMLAAFRRHPARTFADAALDAVLTLLVHEGVGRVHPGDVRGPRPGRRPAPAVHPRQSDGRPARPVRGRVGPQLHVARPPGRLVRGRQRLAGQGCGSA